MLPKRIVRVVGVVLGAGVCVAGCGREDEPLAPPRPADETSPSTAAATTQDASRPRVVFLGDSLTAGYGHAAEQAFPAVVGEMLRDQRVDVRVTNAGVSGDTTAGGLRRIDWVLKQKPDVVVIGLGGNDGLRGVPLESSEENLRTIIRKSREAGAQVLLLGMMIPPNYGPDYAGRFQALYPKLASEFGLEVVPFLLEGVGGNPELNLPDGIHPTEEGHRVVARNVVPHLRTVLGKSDERTPTP